MCQFLLGKVLRLQRVREPYFAERCQFLLGKVLQSNELRTAPEFMAARGVNSS